MLIDSRGRKVQLIKRESTESMLAPLREIYEPEEPRSVSGFFALAARARLITFSQKQSAFANRR